jgi:hypothetical protein
MSAAFWLSVPGRTKRFVSKSERPETATPAARTATIQIPRTAQRKRIIVRAQRAIKLPLLLFFVVFDMDPIVLERTRPRIVDAPSFDA